jgi:hypothetical protein
MSDPRVQELIAECRRQEESCRYTGSNLYIWQKHASRWKAAFLIAPIVLGGIASSQILSSFGGEVGSTIAAFLSLLAGFFPAIYVSLNLDMQVAAIGRAAAEFTNLRDRFRQAANIKSHAPYDEFQAEFEVLMDRMDAVRASAPPAPEWCFEQTKEKMEKGHYDFDADKHNS